MKNLEPEFKRFLWIGHEQGVDFFNEDTLLAFLENEMVFNLRFAVKRFVIWKGEANDISSGTPKRIGVTPENIALSFSS